MNLALLAPWGLAALAALALPVLLHLVRRLELERTEFAALRWIGERVRPRRRLRFERPWLLLLRLVLLAALALLLAQPVAVQPGSARAPWLAVAPGVDRASALALAATTGREAHWLAPGFPALGEASPPAVPAIASLLRELDAQLPPGETMAVVVPQTLAGLDAERLRFSRPVDWEVVPGRTPYADAARPPIVFAVRYPPGHGADAALASLRAVVAAWNLREPGRYTLDSAPAGTPLPASADWLAWLGGDLPAAIQAWVEAGGAVLRTGQSRQDGEVTWRSADGRVLARSRRVGAGRELALAGSLSPADLPLVLEPGFPRRLRDALAPPEPPGRADAAAIRPLAGRSPVAADALPARASRPLDGWLALLVALLFLLERLVATQARPGRAP